MEQWKFPGELYVSDDRTTMLDEFEIHAMKGYRPGVQAPIHMVNITMRTHPVADVSQTNEMDLFVPLNAAEAFARMLSRAVSNLRNLEAK